MFITPNDITKTCTLQGLSSPVNVQWRAGHENGHAGGMGKKKTEPSGSVAVALLAENLRALMAKGPYRNPNALTVAFPAISRPTIDGILDRTRAVGIDKLDVLAAAFGVPAWQLLVPAQPAAHKAVPRTPGPKAKRRPTGEAAELLQSLTEVHRQVRKQYRGASEGHQHEKSSVGSNGSHSNKPRPKGGKKVA